jgi:hypothetical protein
VRGRISHPSLQPDGMLPVAPSAIKPSGEAFIENENGEGELVPFVTPRALQIEEMPYIVRQYRAEREMHWRPDSTVWRSTLPMVISSISSSIPAATNARGAMPDDLGGLGGKFWVVALAPRFAPVEIDLGRAESARPAARARRPVRWQSAVPSRRESGRRRTFQDSQNAPAGLVHIVLVHIVTSHLLTLSNPYSPLVMASACRAYDPHPAHCGGYCSGRKILGALAAIVTISNPLPSPVRLDGRDTTLGVDWGDIATAKVLPMLPKPSGSHRMRRSRPSGTDQTRTVLSSEAVTAKGFSASVSMRDWGAVQPGLYAQDRLAREALVRLLRAHRPC